MSLAVRLGAIVASAIVTLFILTSVVVVIITVAMAVVTFIFLCSGYAPRSVESGAAKFARKFKDVILPEMKKVNWEFTEIIPNEIMVGRVPRHMEHVQSLKSAGVGAIISVNEAWELFVHPEELQKLDIEFLHLPTPDYYAPTTEDINKGVQFIQKHLKEKKTPVFCHCNAGKGRSVIIVLAFIVLSKKMSPYEAYNFVREKKASYFWSSRFMRD